MMSEDVHGRWQVVAVVYGEMRTEKEACLIAHSSFSEGKRCLTRAMRAVVGWPSVVLDGELAVPWTRNPL